MDDATFTLAYGIFLVVGIGVLLFLLAKGLDRKRYLRPVVYGFFFGVGCNFLFSGGIIAYLLGGAVTGYLLAREVGGWWPQFRAGALNGVLVDAIILLTILLLLLVHGASQAVGHQVGSGDLFLLYRDSILVIFRDVTTIGAGAVLGGMLRKLLKPAAQKT